MQRVIYSDVWGHVVGAYSECKFGDNGGKRKRQEGQEGRILGTFF
jgi:hypothetical protein